MREFGMAGTTKAIMQALPVQAWPRDHGAVLVARMPPPLLTRLAELSALLPRRHGGPIDILLAAARPFDDGFKPLRPLWMQESMHRAIGMLRLFTALHLRDRSRPSPRNIHERQLALHLAGELASLETVEVSRVLPCSGPLREIARDLVGLFGPAVGQVVLETDVTSLSLPAYRRRALVLLASDLVTNALTHAFQGRRAGRILLRLQRIGSDHARLQVGDDGVGYIKSRPDPARNIAGALTDLLEGEIGYRDPPGLGSTAEIVFPINS